MPSTPMFAALLVVAALAGCAGLPGGGGDAARQDLVAQCRADADRVYAAQNRYQLSERDSGDTPFSGTGTTQTANRALADQYSQRQSVNQCVRTQGVTH